MGQKNDDVTHFCLQSSIIDLDISIYVLPILLHCLKRHIGENAFVAFLGHFNVILMHLHYTEPFVSYNVAINFTNFPNKTSRFFYITSIFITEI